MLPDPKSSNDRFVTCFLMDDSAVLTVLEAFVALELCSRSDSYIALKHLNGANRYCSLVQLKASTLSSSAAYAHLFADFRMAMVSIRSCLS